MSSTASAAMRRTIALSSAHSVADWGSEVTYRPPEWSSPWKRPVVPWPEVHPLQEHRPEAPHGGVADDPEAGRAAADDEDVTFERVSYWSSPSRPSRTTW